MIYIVTALYEEGKYFIKKYNLKKDMSYKRVQVFKGDNAILMICGTSMLKSAINVTEVLCKETIKETDFLFNIGICGGNKDKTEKGQTYYINKITDSTTNKNFYPTVLYKHNFKEAEILTFPIEVKDGLNGDIFLCDMESSAIYQSAIRFFENDKIIFLKTVSDHCDGNYNIDEIRKIIDSSNEKISHWIEGFSVQNGSDDYEDIIDNFCSKLSFNTNMKKKAKELLLYHIYNGGNTNELINGNEVPDICEKRQVKEYLEQLERKIIQ